MTSRTFNAREINHLIKHKRFSEKLSKYEQMPVEYITGFAEFMERDFVVSADTLIPRIETEELVRLTIQFIKEEFPQGSSLSCIDVGTGTGCLGISLGLALAKDYSVSSQLLDVSAQSIAIAQINKKRLVPVEMHKSFTLLQSNLLDQIDKNSRIDVVVANLPYIPSHRIDQLEPSVREYEPRLALDGGTDGLTLVRQLLGQIDQLKNKPSLITLEVDHSITTVGVPKLCGYMASLHKDQFGKNRFLVFKLLK